MPWLYVNRAYRLPGQGTTSNARRQRRLAAGVSSSNPAYRDVARREGEWEWEEGEEDEEEEWGWDWGGNDGKKDGRASPKAGTGKMR